jgi:hypothetical protein
MKISTVVSSALLSVVFLSTKGVSATGTPSRGLRGKNRIKSVKYDLFAPSDLGQLDIRDLVAGIFATSGDGAAFFNL